MNSKYKVLKFKSGLSNEIDDQISIEEPLEIIIKYKDKERWVENTISITMRTPGDDEDLVRGFLLVLKDRIKIHNDPLQNLVYISGSQIT